MDLGLSQRELARQLGVSKSSIESWEGNEVEPARWLVPRIRESIGFQPSQPPASFAGRLTAHRRGLGLSQEALARMLEVHKTTVVRWETGRRRPSKAAEQRLSSQLKLVP
jgi:DNA-binding transcriptional regulator YiaG